VTIGSGLSFQSCTSVSFVSVNATAFTLEPRRLGSIGQRLRPLLISQARTSVLDERRVGPLAPLLQHGRVHRRLIGGDLATEKPVQPGPCRRVLAPYRPARAVVGGDTRPAGVALPVASIRRAPRGLAADERFRRWSTKYPRAIASPRTIQAFTSVILELDSRPILPLGQAPTLVLAKQGFRSSPSNRLATWPSLPGPTRCWPGRHLTTDPQRGLTPASRC
jgi:hypothetical protein